MLYLLRSYLRDGKSILKVGFAEDYDYRINQYKSHNPGIEEVGKKEGTMVDEIEYHIYLHYLGFGSLKNEWYIDCQEVIDIFNSPGNMDKILWDTRQDIFKSTDFIKQNNKFCVYERLFGLFKDSIYKKSDLGRGEYYYVDSDKDIDYSYISLVSKWELDSLMERIVTKGEVLDEADKALVEFFNYNEFPDRMRYIYSLSSDIIDSVLDKLSMNYNIFYRTIDPDEAKRLSYRKGEFEKRYDRNKNNQSVDIDSLANQIYSSFKIGDRYSKSEIKERLGDIYKQIKFDKTPKAVDLENYFDLKRCAISIDGKRVEGYELKNKG